MPILKLKSIQFLELFTFCDNLSSLLSLFSTGISKYIITNFETFRKVNGSHGWVSTVGCKFNSLVSTFRCFLNMYSVSSVQQFRRKCLKLNHISYSTGTHCLKLVAIFFFCPDKISLGQAFFFLIKPTNLQYFCAVFYLCVFVVALFFHGYLILSLSCVLDKHLLIDTLCSAAVDTNYN